MTKVSRPNTHTSGSLASIAADWEDAMLHSCVSNDNDNTTNYKQQTKVASNGNDDICSGSDHDVYESFADQKRRQLQQQQQAARKQQQQLVRTTYSDDSTVVDTDTYTSDEDSDISLCRSPCRGRPRGRSREPRTPPHLHVSYSPSKTNINNNDQEEADGECSTISVVTSLASLFLGKDGPCSLHNDDAANESIVIEIDANSNRISALDNGTASSRSTNTRIATSQPLFKKSSLKRQSQPQPVSSPDTSSFLSRSIQKQHSKRNVTFDSVNLREYTISLSQNPSCSEGPPIELGWEFQEQVSLPIESFEETRQPRRRKLQDLLLNENVRTSMLLEKYSPTELRDAMRQVDHFKRQRVMTYMLLPAAALDEAAEEMYTYIFQAFK